jgi:hypothetical protein
VAVSDGGEIAVRLLWIDLDEQSVQMANQFIGQVDGDEIILSIGCATPPIITGDTIEERQAQAENIGYVPVRPIARIAVTKARLAELMVILDLTQKNYNAAHGVEEGGEV